MQFTPQLRSFTPISTQHLFVFGFIWQSLVTALIIFSRVILRETLHLSQSGLFSGPTVIGHCGQISPFGVIITWRVYQALIHGQVDLTKHGIQSHVYQLTSHISSLLAVVLEIMQIVATPFAYFPLYVQATLRKVQPVVTTRYQFKFQRTISIWCWFRTRPDHIIIDDTSLDGRHGAEVQIARATWDTRHSHHASRGYCWHDCL